MNHCCPIDGCQLSVPQNVFMCARHWRLVPKPLQAAVYDAYRSGLRASNSQSHREAIRVVCEAEKDRAVCQLPAGTKALTIWQPWASLIMIGAKPWEFRGWNFADKPHLAKLVGQRIVVHAGARKPSARELDDILHRIDQGTSGLRSAVAKPFIRNLLENATKPGFALPLAAALGTATIGNPVNAIEIIVQGEQDAPEDSDRGAFNYAWPMKDPQPFPLPVPAAGAQGFWNWS